MKPQKGGASEEKRCAWENWGSEENELKSDSSTRKTEHYNHIINGTGK